MLKTEKGIFFRLPHQIIRQPERTKKRTLQIMWSIVRFIFLICLSYVVLSPIISAISISLREVRDIKDPSVIWIPRHFTFANIVNAVEQMKFWEALKNTVLICGISSLLQVLTCAVIAYGFSRFKFCGNKLLFLLVLITMIIPMQVLYVPTYFLFYKLKLLNTVWSMYLPAIFGVGIRSGLFIYIYRQFYNNLPRELEEAALVDGCGYYRTFVKIILPSVRVAIITVFLFSFVWYYNDTSFTGLYFNDKLLITTALSSFQSALATEGRADPITISVLVQSGSLLSILPVMIIYIVFHRFFTEGIERSGIVG